ncbi:MAG: hypothetical protein HOY76_19710 [Streptomyces sp.]|nr:hypothetical protein [Streptomyces sp.]
MPAPCPGPCNNAWRRAEAALNETGTEHHITPAWGDPTQCWGCVQATRAQLLELPALLAAVLNEALDGTPTKLTGTIGRSSIVTWPGEACRLFIDRIVEGMTVLQADILILRGYWNPEHEPLPTLAPNEAGHIAAIVNSLDAHWGWAMQNHPCADEQYGQGGANPGSQVTGWHHALQRFTKQDEQRDVKRLAPCPRCKGPYLVESTELRLVDDEPYIECRDPDCRRIMTTAEYDRYVKDLNEAIRAAA